MIGFPLLLIPLALYNIVVFLMPGVSLTEPLVKLTLVSGAEWPITLSDMLLTLGVLLLLSEIIRSARPGAKYLTDHLLSLIVLGAASAEFVLWPRFGTSTYLLLTMLALVDFLSGIALRTRRGKQVASVPVASGQGARMPAAAPEPHPAAAPSAPPAASATESVPPDHSEPKIEHRDVTPNPPSPVVTSPELQPGNGSPPSRDVPPR